MPRKNPLPIREREICHRLLSARKALRLTRVAFAREAGIDSSELRRYEEARSPLLARSALALCHAHGFGLPWLATGKESPVVGPHVPVLSEQTGIPERASFV